MNGALQMLQAPSVFDLPMNATLSKPSRQYPEKDFPTFLEYWSCNDFLDYLDLLIKDEGKVRGVEIWAGDYDDAAGNFIGRDDCYKDRDS